ncbi:MAG: hypothetical protein JWM59_4412 [Verrucomicrobiales bacterium]|nr:hypothetical protein [Verrucomicrobiales bacterium]
MSDDPRKKYKDRFTVDLNDAHERSYFHSVLKKEFPGKSDAEIESAVRTAAKEIAPSESREKLTEHVRQLLS